MKRIITFLIVVAGVSLQGQTTQAPIKQSALPFQTTILDTDNLMGWRTMSGNLPFNYNVLVLANYVNGKLVGVYQPYNANLLAYANAADAAARRALIGAGTSSFAGTYAALPDKPTIPAQFNPVAGTNITLSGTYPNITINATGGTFDLDALTAGTDADIGDTDRFLFSDAGTEKSVTVAAFKTWFQAQNLTFGSFAASNFLVNGWDAASAPLPASLIPSTQATDTELAAAIAGISAGSLPVGARCDLVTGTTPPATFLLADGSNGTPTITGATGTTAYIQGNGTVATPTVDVAAGTYTSTQSVTPSTATGGVSMYYTFGSSPADPTTSSTAVSGAISVSASGTLKVRAFKNLYSPSAVLSAAYTITGGSTPGFIAYADFTGTDSATSSSLDTTGANCVAVFVSWWSGGTVGGSPLTDSKGNTYTAISGGTSAGGTWYIATNATVGTGHTVTFTTTGAYPFVRVIALSNIATASALDVQAQASGSGVSTQASGAMTTTVGNTMVLAGLVLGNSMSGISVDSGLTLAGSTSNAGGIAYGVKAAGSVNPAFTWTGTTSATTYAIALKSN